MIKDKKERREMDLFCQGDEISESSSTAQDTTQGDTKQYPIKRYVVRTFASKSCNLAKKFNPKQIKEKK